jgi:hypothetical protein
VPPPAPTADPPAVPTPNVAQAPTPVAASPANDLGLSNSDGLPSDADVDEAVRGVYAMDPYVFAQACLHPKDVGEIQQTTVAQRYPPVATTKSIRGLPLEGTDYRFLVRITFADAPSADYKVVLFVADDGDRLANVNECHGWYPLT